MSNGIPKILRFFCNFTILAISKKATSNVLNFLFWVKEALLTTGILSD